LLEQTPNLAPVDAGKVATEVVTSARVTFPGTLQVVAETGATVVADQVVLRRALTNLVENATRAAGPEGTVMVSVRRAGGWVSCEVSDSGPGFGAGPPGAGSLGLSIVERFVRTHHGRLDVSRGALGGALVRLRLPDPRRRLLSRAQSGIRGKVLH
ncbi:MAG: sensor histidine kinase, partial [Candidatus Methylomirabilales bacterium]